MNKETEIRLKHLYDKYTMIQLTLFCLTEKRAGKWLKTKGKDGTIYINELEDVKIIEDSNGELRAVQISNDYSCPIEDGKIIDIINELRPKPKKVAKKEATPKKNYKNATWLDAFKRVADYLGGTRYALYVGGDEEWEDCSEDDEVSMGVCDEDEDRDGEQWLHWDSVKDFLTKPLERNHCNTNSDGCANIFESVSFWESHRYKVELGSPYLIWLIDTIGELGKVDIKKCDTPEKLMKALDKVGL